MSIQIETNNTSALDRDHIIPLFYQTANILRQEILEMKEAGRFYTERELVERFGINRITVSRALNQLVKEGYLYRIQGKGTFVRKMERKKRQRHSILFIIPHPLKYYIKRRDWAFADLIQGVMDEANRAGNVMIFDIPKGADETEYCVDQIMHSGADGIILNPYKNAAEILTIIHREKRAYTLLNVKPADQGRENNVLAGERDGVAGAVYYLAGLGHRRIMYICYEKEGLLAEVDRFKGYLQGLEMSGLEYDASLVKSIDRFPEDVEGVFSRSGHPTAVVAVNDYYAIKTVELLRTLGLEVPGDVSVTGFDDMPEAAEAKPALTTVRMPRYEMGREAVRYLADMINDGFAVRGVRFLDTELVIRESCGPVAGRP